MGVNTTKVIKAGDLGTALAKILHQFDVTSVKKADMVVEEAFRNLAGAIVEETPVGVVPTKGTLKGSWRITVNRKSRAKFQGRKMPNRTRRDLKIPSDIMSKDRSVFLSNNSPQINVVEFGGYKKNPKVGTFNPETGRFEIRSKGGFSKQAPKGMVRKNIKKWPRILDLAANKVFGI